MPQQVEHTGGEPLHLADLPVLRLAAWNRNPAGTITRADAFSIYERNWRHIKNIEMDPQEKCVFDDLVRVEGRGAFAV